MSAEPVILRAATLADADLLLAWRNDRDTIRNSFAGRRVARAAHVRWLQAILRNGRRKVFIAGRMTERGYGCARDVSWVPVGTGRLDWSGHVVELSLTVAPECRGQGVGGALITALAEEAQRWKPGAPMIAHVKPRNTASLRAFLRAGFALTGARCLRLERVA